MKDNKTVEIDVAFWFSDLQSENLRNAAVNTLAELGIQCKNGDFITAKYETISNNMTDIMDEVFNTCVLRRSLFIFLYDL